MSIDVVALVGAGGHGSVVADAAHQQGMRNLVFYSEEPGQVGQTLLGYPIRLLEQMAPIRLFHVCIGHNRTRERINSVLLAWGHEAVSIVHGAAVVASSSDLGPGCFVAAGAILAPRSSVGPASIVNHGAVVDHDVLVGICCHIGPAATLGGAVRIGNRVLIGAGATVLPGVVIGDGATIGAGAVVLDDVMPDATVVGVPARAI